MKPVIHFVVLCLFAMQFVACTKEATKPSSPLPVTATSVAGNFTLGSFVSNSDQTASFDGYAFTFKENGTITATKDGRILNGTWRFDDGNNTEIKIIFSDAPLNQLNGSWHIDDLTDDHMYLSNGGEHEDHNDDHSSDNNHLEFERD